MARFVLIYRETVIAALADQDGSARLSNSVDTVRCLKPVLLAREPGNAEILTIIQLTF